MQIQHSQLGHGNGRRLKNGHVSYAHNDIRLRGSVSGKVVGVNCIQGHSAHLLEAQ